MKLKADVAARPCNHDFGSYFALRVEILEADQTVTFKLPGHQYRELRRNHGSVYLEKFFNELAERINMGGR